MTLGGNSKDEFVTSLAAMALYDGEAEISAAQISALLDATNNKVAAYWPSLFAGFLKGRIETLIFSGGAGAGSAPAAAAPAAAAGGAAPAEKKEKPKVEEVDALEGGMDMFGGGGGGGGDY